MADIQSKFAVIKQDLDYFLRCGIDWDPITSIIKLDPGKYLGEILAKYDMLGAHSSAIPIQRALKFT